MRLGYRIRMSTKRLRIAISSSFAFYLQVSASSTCEKGLETRSPTSIRVDLVVCLEDEETLLCGGVLVTYADAYRTRAKSCRQPSRIELVMFLAVDDLCETKRQNDRAFCGVRQICVRAACK
jgi:hypothetical protein